VRRRAKFRGDRSKRTAEIYCDFLFFNVAAAAMLDFQNAEI